MNPAGFEVSDSCIGCGLCIKVCPGGVLFMGPDKRPHIRDFQEFGWNGCWQCDHCLSVCPKGAVRIGGHDPNDSLNPPAVSESAPLFDALIANRHSCRRFQQRNVPSGEIRDMIERLANAPNGGNKQQVEYTLIDDMEEMQYFRQIVAEKMTGLAARGIYPEGFDEPSYNDMKGWERTVRPDMFFCGAPHLLIPHAPCGHGEPVQDVNIACTYFELLCASRGLGAVMLTFPLGVLRVMPEVKALLNIPDSYYTAMMIGFGYPEILYRRGAQRKTSESRIHRLSFTTD